MSARLAGVAALVALALSACASGGSGSTSAPLPPPAARVHHRGSPSTPIQHVIIVIQENRSFDNLFATFPNANGTTTG